MNKKCWSVTCTVLRTAELLWFQDDDDDENWSLKWMYWLSMRPIWCFPYKHVVTGVKYHSERPKPAHRSSDVRTQKHPKPTHRTRDVTTQKRPKPSTGHVTSQFRNVRNQLTGHVMSQLRNVRNHPTGQVTSELRNVRNQPTGQVTSELRNIRNQPTGHVMSQLRNVRNHPQVTWRHNSETSETTLQVKWRPNSETIHRSRDVTTQKRPKPFTGHVTSHLRNVRNHPQDTWRHTSKTHTRLSAAVQWLTPISSVLLQSDLFAQVTCRDLKTEDGVEQNKAKCGVFYVSSCVPFSFLKLLERWEQRNPINAVFNGY
jgi:hypothetical protein